LKYDSVQDGYFEWEIDNWKKLKGIENSPEFKLCGYKWYK